MRLTRLLQTSFLVSATLIAILGLPFAEAASPTLKTTSSGTVPTGSTFTIEVKIAHFAPGCCSFDTFGVTVHIDTSVISPTSITLGPKISAWTVFESCVHGVGIACDINQGAGDATLVAASNTGFPIFHHGPLVLFTITYTAVNVNPSTCICITKQTFEKAGVTITGIVLVNGTYS